MRHISGALSRGELGDTGGFAGYFRALARQSAQGLWLTGVFSAVSTPLQQGEFDRSSYLLKQEQTRSATAKEEMKNKYLADGEQEATTLNMQISDAVESFFASFTQKGETDK